MTNPTQNLEASERSAKPQAHLRLTASEILQGWLEHYYTPAGYLYHLILALRREGWWYRIENVSQFCRQWQINRRTFYRAKAELIEKGVLEENIIGGLDLRVPVSQFGSPGTTATQPMTDLAQPVTTLTQPVTDLTQPAPKTGSGQAVYGPTDLLQIPPISVSAPEREAKNWQTDPQFRQWLKDKAKRLPEPPEFLEPWIDAQTQKESFQREYQASQNRSAKTHLPPPPPDRFQIETACISAMDRQDLSYVQQRLQNLWAAGWIELVAELLEAHNWSLHLTCSGVAVDD